MAVVKVLVLVASKELFVKVYRHLFEEPPVVVFGVRCVKLYRQSF